MKVFVISLLIVAVLLCYVETTSETMKVARALARVKQQMKAKTTVQSSLKTLENVAVSAEDTNTAEVAMLLQSPDVQAAMNAETPDAVDRLIQGILEGKGSGGVVTTEFNQGGVHATIISNVNELRVTQVDNSKEERTKVMSEQQRKKVMTDTNQQAAEAGSKRDANFAKQMGGESSLRG